ncbi:nuclease-related domain-containing protein [Cellulomonas sp.]|uniref:nuclease-related domain-containing protein n=1 Tax=Cellulomonas sp. TaxID=40001 RepID=UPI0025866D2E|nr:nuclease-related domain-containing protein [Cellulomonas sp.]MCR6689097.1 NERD domain-containing protein [Cellulomonas sp.]
MEQVLTVRRWRRYGADRLYVTHETGARVGSIDLQSGEVVVEEPELEEQLRLAAQEFLRSDANELTLPMPRQPFSEPERTALTAWLGPVDEPRGQRGAPLRQRLERLYAEGWHVIHDVPLGRQGTVVEHLLIGPGGIFTVAERGRPGERVDVVDRRMLVDGAPVGLLHAARMEAARVQGLLLQAGCADIRVRSMIVVRGELGLDGDADETLVVTRATMPRTVRSLPVALEPDRVAAIANVARQRITWAR